MIAGRCKGRRLRPPGWEGLRPTSDRLRGSLFEVIGARVEGARLLDGFAGTGAVGIEALSRGAAHVTFVETDRRAVALITKNLASAGLTGGYTVDPRPVHVVLAQWPGEPLDLVFLDPPYYETGDLGELLKVAASVLAPSGLLVLEHAVRRDAPPAAGTLPRVRLLRAGDSALSFYAAASGAPGGEEVERS